MKLLKSKWKRGLSFAMVAVLSVGLLAGCGSTTPAEEDPSPTTPAVNKTVNIGYVNWAESVAVTYLWKEILEEKDYTVNATSLELAPLFVGLSKGNLDVFMDAWLPYTHQSYLDHYKSDLDDYGVWYEGESKSGLVVPKYVDIDSIEDLKAKRAEFEGKIIGIDPGAGIMKLADAANKSYGLGYEIIMSSEAAMLTALDKAYRDKKWIAIPGWSPHWMFAKYDLKYLEDPKGDFGGSEEIHTLANKKFTQKNPEVVKMMKAFKLSDQQIGDLEALIKEGMAPQEAAKSWIKDNRALVDGWLK